MSAPFFRLVLDPHSHALAVNYSIRQTKLQREVTAVTLELLKWASIEINAREGRCNRVKRKKEKEIRVNSLKAIISFVAFFIIHVLF